MYIEAIPAFSDNYIWVFSAPNSNDFWCVDPGDAQPVLDALDSMGGKLAGCLITHYHFDHIGGIETLLQAYPEMLVYTPKREAVEGSTKELVENDTVECGGFTFRVIEVPGHTSGHIAYYCESEQKLFCGDTLFSAGCGRLFEGTPQQMHNSLSKLSALPEATGVYCTHEYTTANVAFALAVEPENAELQQYRDWVEQQRKLNLPTLPSSIARERAINPFLRCHTDSVQQAAKAANTNDQQSESDTSDEIATFATIRKWKDSF